jgi:hypothetical protein
MVSSLYRNHLWMLALAVGALALAARPARAAGPTTSAFSATGSGVSLGATPGCSQCTTGHICTCVPITGKGKASEIGDVTFNTVFVIDGTNATAGVCNDSYGTLTLTDNKNSKNKLVIQYHGFLCGLASEGSVNGTYVIDPTKSAGKFAGYNGSGNLGGSENLNNDDILGNLNGTIQTP